MVGSTPFYLQRPRDTPNGHAEEVRQEDEGSSDQIAGRAALQMQGGQLIHSTGTRRGRTTLGDDEDASGFECADISATSSPAKAGSAFLRPQSIRVASPARFKVKVSRKHTRLVDEVEEQPASLEDARGSMNDKDGLG